MALKQGNGLQGWEIAVTKKLIGEFRRRSRSLYREEFDDLLQECLMHWLEVRQQLVPDPGGPPIAYMARVVRNKLIDLARERETDKRRGDQETVSLDDTVGDSEDAPIYADLVDAEQGRNPGGQESFDPADIRIDVTEVMRRLTPESGACAICSVHRACPSKRHQRSSESRAQRSTRKSNVSARSSPSMVWTTICNPDPTLCRGISYD